MLYRPEAFEPLVETVWNEARARDAIRDIVADTDAGFRGPKLFWKADEWDGWHATSPMKNLYVGTAGVLWALNRLRHFGYAETKLDLAELATRNVELSRERPDFMKGMTLPTPREGALMTGETGILLIAWRLTQNAEFADDLHALVQANVDNEADEVMWGAPGSSSRRRRCVGGHTKSGGRLFETRPPKRSSRGAIWTATGPSGCTARNSEA